MISGRVDVIVVGAGVIGLATAHEVARRGMSVLCFEQGACGSGQSAGHTRIFRVVHDGDHMALRAMRARAAWRDLESQLGESLVGSEGVLVYPDGEVDVNRWASLGIEVRQLSPGQIKSLLPLGQPGALPAGEALLDVGGGAIRADRVCSGLARSLEANLRAGRVLGLRAGEDEVEVQTSVGVWSCRRAIVAAGVHTAGLAAAHGVEVPERRGVHPQITFEVRPGAEPPCFLDYSNRFGERAYGSIAPGKRQMAVGLDHRGELLDVLAGDVLPPSTALHEAEERILVYAKEALPAVLGAPASSRLCVFTPLGADVDAFSAWQKGPLTFVGGHNAFKFAPLIAGELADVAEGGPVAEQLHPLTEAPR